MPHTVEVITALFGVLFLLLPGGLVLLGREQAKADTSKVLSGIPIGLALSLVTATVFCQWSLTAAAIAVALLAILGAVAVLWKYRPGVITAPRGWLLVGVILITLIKLAPLMIYPDPRGFDPYFHLLLADKIMLTGKTISSWQPYAMIDSINYPLGLHFLLAVVATWLPVTLTAIFSVFTVVVISLTGVVLYQFIFNCTKNTLLAVVTALAFLFLPDLGSIDYPFWGGLPNAIGMLLLLGAFLFIGYAHTESETTGPKRIALLALFWLAITFAHHHVMLVTGLVCLVEWIFALKNRNKDPSLFKDLTFSALAAALLGSWYYLPYVKKLLTVQNTSVFAYYEPLMTPAKIWHDAGPIFCLLVIAGLILTFRRKESAGQIRTISPVTRILLTLLAGFFIFEYVVRLVSPYILGREIIAFTPARFLTDAIPLLSMFAAIALLSLKSRWHLREATLAAVILILGISAHWPKFALLLTPEVPEAKKAAYEFIRDHSSPDALVIDSSYAASYFSKRAGSHTPIPSSEARKPLFETVSHVKTLLSDGTWPDDWKTRQLLCISNDDDVTAVPLATKKLWQHPNGLAVFEFIRPSI